MHVGRVTAMRLAFVVLLFFAAACESSELTVSAQFEREQKALSPKLSLEIAHTEATRRHGLMFRKHLASNNGMLFLFPDNQLRGFWMKNTYIDLDIIFLNSNWRIVSIGQGKAHSTRRVESAGSAKYVVEVPAGNAEHWGLRPGDLLVVRNIDKLPTPH